MSDFSSKLTDFAARLDTEPEAVQAIFQYCLAAWLVEEGQAELVKVEIQSRNPWCTFKTVSGDEFTVLRPSLSQAEERQMIETLWEIFYPAEGEENRPGTEGAREPGLIPAKPQRTVRQSEPLRRKPKPPRKRPMRARNKEIIVAVLEGMTWREAGQKLGLSHNRIKQIYASELHRLYRLQRALGLKPEDLALISHQERPQPLARQRRYAGRIKALLEKMWVYEESSADVL